MLSRRWTGGVWAFWCTSFWLVDLPSLLMEMRTRTQTLPSMDSPCSCSCFFPFFFICNHFHNPTDHICLSHPRRISKRDPPFPKDMGPLAKDLIQRLLIKDPKKRLGSGPSGADNVKKHPFYQVDLTASLQYFTIIEKQSTKLISQCFFMICFTVEN